ncbi:MAG: nucleotidyltransferase domain-containing protein [bacterium]
MTWEELFADWAKPPGKSEQDRCENTARAIREAIANSDKLNYRNVRVFIHGSLRNRVNVRAESDVDGGTLYPGTFFSEPPPGHTRDELGEDATYQYPQFKKEVGEALVAHFGRDAVRRTNKTFEVRANTYRVDADVTPFFEYRHYVTLDRWHTGVAFIPDNGRLIVNWPEQNYANGVAKNQATGESFKGIVRILKRLAVEMEARNVAAARSVCGFLVESMAYNTPDACFTYSTWWKSVREVLAFIFNNTMTDESCAQRTETNEMKFLFHPTQRWTRTEAHAFVDAAWNFLGLQ